MELGKERLAQYIDPDRDESEANNISTIRLQRHKSIEANNAVK